MKTKSNIKLRTYYKYNNKKYYMSKYNKNVVMELSNSEILNAIIISKYLNTTVYLNPRVNFPKNIYSSDYIIFDDNWDLKEIINAKSITRAFDNIVKKHKLQASNYIIDISRSNLGIEEIKQQVDNAFSHGDFYRKWLKRVIIVKNKKVIYDISK